MKSLLAMPKGEDEKRYSKAALSPEFFPRRHGFLAIPAKVSTAFEIG
jgi:hypothetical protein